MKTQLNTSQKIIIFYIILATILCPLEYYKSGVLASLYSLEKILPLLFSILIFLKEYKHIRCLTKYEFLLLAWFTVTLLFTIFFNVIYDYQGNLTFMFIYFNIFIAIFSNRIIDEEVLLKAFSIIAIVGVVAFVWFFFYEGFDLSMIVGQQWSHYVWGESFYYCQLLWITPYFVLLSVVCEKKITPYVIVWGVYLLFNLLFLKRYAFVDSVLVGCLIVFDLKRKQKIDLNQIIKVFFILAIITVVLIFSFRDALNGLISSLWSRVESTSGDLSSFDRFVESGEYFKSCGILKFIFGGGFLNHFISSSAGTIRYNLHIGWSDFIFHGGLLLLAIVLIPCLRLPQILKNYRYLNKFDQFTVLAILLNIIRFVYLGPAAFYPIMLLTYVLIIRLNNINLEITHQKMEFEDF